MVSSKRASAGVLLIIAGYAVGVLASCSGRHPAEFQPPAYTTSGQFTPAHPSVRDAVKDYLDVYPTQVQQPVHFDHHAHLTNGMKCVNCHQGVAQGPQAGIPSVQFCMTCHQVIATDRPEIKKVAAYQAQGQDIPWQRVYWYYPSDHVRFAHAPHIRAGIDCATCHGDVKDQTVAVRKAGLDMGYCLNCHRERKASTDCTTCHN